MTPARQTFGFAQASRRWWVVLLVLVGASFLVYRNRDAVAPATAARFGGAAQGTTYSVVLGGPRPAAVRMALQSSVDSLLAEIDATMSTYDSTSELSRLNRSRLVTPVALSPSLAQVLHDAQHVSRASDGAFDVTVGPLVDAWGFGASGDDGAVPDDSVLTAMRARVGWEKLRLDSFSLIRTQPDIEIDLNAIAPGHAVDRISALLSARGETNHLVELGGEMRARGRNAEGQPFRVGIESPDPERRTVRVVVGLADRALATSGNYRDFRDVNGVRYVHTLDPSTGRPVTHRLLSVSVLHERCAMADAWATALLVVGPERAWAMAQANELEVLLLIAGANGEVQERMSDGFSAIVRRDAKDAPPKETR